MSNAGYQAGRFGFVFFGLSLCRYSPTHAVKKWHRMFKRKSWCFGVLWWERTTRPTKQALPVVRQEDLGLCVFWSLSLSLQSVPRCKQVALEEEELVFWYSLVGADRPPKQAMPVASQEDLSLCVLWLLSLSLQSGPRCKKVASYV